jgi:MOSC domain-containing protein YiiM
LVTILGDAVLGQRWRINDATLEISEPRMPCYKLGICMDDRGFPAMFSAAGRPGSYLRIVVRGSLAAGDHIEIGPAPGHGLTVADIARIYQRDRHERHRRARPGIDQALDRMAGKSEPRTTRRWKMRPGGKAATRTHISASTCRPAT